jgi:ribosomal protein L2
MPNVVDQWKFGGSTTGGPGGQLGKLGKQGYSGPLKLLTVGSKRGSGRNNTGRITAFHRGGGSKQSYRQLDTFCEYRFQDAASTSWGPSSTTSSWIQGMGVPGVQGTAVDKASLRSSSDRFGRIVRLEYDPNRSGCIALVEWYSTYDDLYWYGGQSSAVSSWLTAPVVKKVCLGDKATDACIPSFYKRDSMIGAILHKPAAVSYILAMEGMVVGGWLYWRKSSPVILQQEKSVKGLSNKGLASSAVAITTKLPPSQEKSVDLVDLTRFRPRGAMWVAPPPECANDGGDWDDSTEDEESPKIVSTSPKNFMDVDVKGGGVAGWHASVPRDFWSQPGIRLPLKEMVIGSTVCNVDGRYLRSAGSFGQVLAKEVVSKSLSLSLTGSSTDSTDGDVSVVVRFASGVRQRFSGNCLASMGCVSKRSSLGFKASSVLKSTKKGKAGLLKAGASRWRGRRPIVRGVAMNPVDHPHGGGEGRTSGGRPSVTPWGKFTKGQPTRKKSKPVLQKDIQRNKNSGRSRR